MTNILVTPHKHAQTHKVTPSSNHGGSEESHSNQLHSEGRYEGLTLPVAGDAQGASHRDWMLTSLSSTLAAAITRVGHRSFWHKSQHPTTIRCRRASLS